MLSGVPTLCGDRTDEWCACNPDCCGNIRARCSRRRNISVGLLHPDSSTRVEKMRYHVAYYPARHGMAPAYTARQFGLAFLCSDWNVKELGKRIQSEEYAQR